MARILVALLLVVSLGMLLTIGASAQPSPGNEQVQSSAVRDFGLVAVGLLGGWGGAFITGLWSSRNLDKRLDHEAEQNRLSREEQRQQLAMQLTMQEQMLRDQLEQKTREYMRAYRERRVEQLLEMIAAIGVAIEQYHEEAKSGKPLDPSKYELQIERRLLRAPFLLGSAELQEEGRALLGEYGALGRAILENPLDNYRERYDAVHEKEARLARAAERYIASG